VCPVYPWSDTHCNICHHFHHTYEHKDLEVRSGDPNELENLRYRIPKNNTNSTRPDHSKMVGLVAFLGDHSTTENKVLKDSDTAFLDLRSVMCADGSAFDAGYVGATPDSRQFVDLDHLLAVLAYNATKPTV